MSTPLSNPVRLPKLLIESNPVEVTVPVLPTRQTQRYWFEAHSLSGKCPFILENCMRVLRNHGFYSDFWYLSSSEGSLKVHYRITIVGTAGCSTLLYRCTAGMLCPFRRTWYSWAILSGQLIHERVTRGGKRGVKTLKTVVENANNVLPTPSEDVCWRLDNAQKKKKKRSDIDVCQVFQWQNSAYAIGVPKTSCLAF